MLIDFNAIPEAVVPHMRGGEKEVRHKKYQDGHSLMNDGDEDLEFLAVIPEQ